MNASDVMTCDHLCACVDTADARSVAKMMAEHDIGSVPVLDKDDRLEGIVTDRDLCCRLIAEGMSFETPIRRVMSRSVATVQPDADLHQVERVMRRRKIRRVPVVDHERKLKGFISFADLTYHLRGTSDEHELVEVFESVCSEHRRK
jgi:CBS domain-containing protein